ncbi:unnamed protein product [Phytophthora fragariaefolia]|uniref:Unnamed protein product n=1 Tax=Phytophthora fragariaefolia TaxID=1490495 RepID=A0A9W6U8I1_9STRA|nr:unnamed protein product [Phytophthora fragariaefolia]
MKLGTLAVALSMVAVPRGLRAASTCPKSGIAPPSEVTLAAAADGADDVAILVKNSDCDEVTIDATSSENPGEYRINASYVDIEVVESYPAVASLTLDLNALTSTSASDFPENLQRLYLRKNSIDSLEKFRFPSSLQYLYLNGNQQLTTLQGAVFPDSLHFIIRESDLDVLKSAQLSLTVSLDSDACSSVSGTVTEISDSISACVLDGEAWHPYDSCSRNDFTYLTFLLFVRVDASFSSLYPVSSDDSGSTTGTSSSKSSSTASGANGGSSTGTGSATGGSSTTVITIHEGSSSNAGLIGGIVAAIVVVILAIVGFIVCRRRRQKHEKRDSHGDGFLALASDKEHSAGETGTDSRTVSAPPSSGSGYLSNDVRNDEDLIPYRLPVEDVVIQKELASGGFGIVYLAQLYGQLVVVKQILPKAMSKDLLRRFMDEIRLFARMDHPKIVHFIGLAWTNLMDLSLIVEYMPRGDLTTLLRKKRGEKGSRRTFSWVGESSQPRSKIDIALDTAEALVYLHSFDPTIIHRDIKSRNVLLNHEWEAKISDFGISRESSDESTMTGGMGTTAWIAPEVLQGDRYSESADIFSFGIMLSEMDTCGHPYNSNRSEEDALTDAKIALLVSTNAIKPTIEADCPPEVRDLILRCVAFHASERPTAVALHYQLRTIANAYQDVAMILVYTHDDGHLEESEDCDDSDGEGASTGTHVEDESDAVTTESESDEEQCTQRRRTGASRNSLTLENFLFKQKLRSSHGGLHERYVAFYAACVVSALEYLHGRGVLYRDLKLENLVLDADGYAKLIDFGLAKPNATRTSERSSTMCGSAEYMAPEILQHKPYDQRVDIWSFGILLYEMLFGTTPFYHANIREQGRRIISAPVEFPDDYEQGHAMVCGLIRKLLEKDPALRLSSFAEVRKTTFFRSYFPSSQGWNQLEARQVEAPFVPRLHGPFDTSLFVHVQDEEELDCGSDADSDFGSNCKVQTFCGLARTRVVA